MKHGWNTKIISKCVLILQGTIIVVKYICLRCFFYVTITISRLGILIFKLVSMAYCIFLYLFCNVQCMVTILYIKTTKYSNEHYNMSLIVVHKQDIFFYKNVFTTHCTYFVCWLLRL